MPNLSRKSQTMIGTPRTRSTKSRDVSPTRTFDDDKPTASGTAPTIPMAKADSVRTIVIGRPWSTAESASTSALQHGKEETAGPCFLRIAHDGARITLFDDLAIGHD